ncbi:MAG: zinc ABC transporter substrate-binding protein [Rhodospirillaceae bacterium]|nr:zinc ABC transporter substrate-binding protein [Rhodospirillaceae bacterium]
MEVGLRRVIGVLGVLLPSLVLFTLGSVPSAAADKPKVVATFSILADLTAQVAGDHAIVAMLVGPDGDAHVFEPGPKDSAALAEADLLVANGLGFEPWLERLSEAAGFKGTLVIASEGITPLPAEQDEHADEAGHGHGAFDPHAFQDLANGQVYVANIAKGLAAIDPAHAAEFAANAQRLAAEMAELDARLKADFGAIPAERRRVLTSHDAFGYFSHAYGVEFLAIHGVSTEAEPSAQDLGKLIAQARAGSITAIFAENMANANLAETVSAESGIRVGGRLYADALSAADGPAPDYLALFRHNAGQLLDALR